MKTTTKKSPARALAKKVTPEEIAALSEKTGIVSTAVTGAGLIPKKVRYHCEPRVAPNGGAVLTTDGFEIWDRKTDDGVVVSSWKVPPQVWTPIDVIEAEAVASDGMAISRLAELTARHLTHVSGLYDELFGGGRRTKESPKTDVPLFSRRMNAAQAVKIATKLANMRRQVRVGSAYDQYFDPPAAAPVQQSLFDQSPYIPTEADDALTIAVPVQTATRFRALCSLVGKSPEEYAAKLIASEVERATAAFRESSK